MSASLWLFAATLLAADVKSPRPLTLDDQHRFKDTGDPQCSPDGKWIAYTLTTTDATADKRDTDIWMVSIDGKENLRLTSSTESESSPRWSPDGRYLAFLSSRPGPAKNRGAQIWLIDRRGGEAQQITDSKSRISGFEWSPDSKRMAVLLREPDDDAPTPPATPSAGPSAAGAATPSKPIVINRYRFKQDGAGYLSSTKKTRIHLFDIEAKKFELLTTMDFDESTPEWSPDGNWITFASNHAPDWDGVPGSDVFVVEAKAGSKPKKLTTFKGQDSRPVFSPDGKWIAYLKGSDHQMGEYNMTQLAVIPATGGAPRIVSAALDRGVMGHEWTPDSQALRFLVSDDMSVYPARVSVNGGAVERLVGGKQVIMSMHSAGGCTAVMLATDLTTPDVHVLEGATPRKLTGHNDALLKEFILASTEEISYKTKDGNEAHGLLVKPVGYEAGKKYPMLLRIHGGPNAQDQHSFAYERQLFAAHGYAVLAINYRGSSGRGQQYTVSIAKDWSNKEVIDLLAGVDHVIAMGVADPDRLGVGGWSYGGILTDALIASTTRFKAATSGAGVAFPLSFYGHDQYIRQYDNEISPPWKGGLEPWLKIGYPFLNANKIKTPTLFLCGDRDFNVPLLGSEQMYQALRNVGTETQLIIYPGENHGIAKPSFQRDRYERYLNWYARFLKNQKPATPTEISKVDKKEWQQLFNGKDLAGWTPKIRGYNFGDNFGNTFRVENGVLKVSYDKYDDFAEKFGHLFYKDKFSFYVLGVEYRFVGQQAPKGPGWAIRNSGAMLHGQAPETMGKDQDFPISIEAQFLGGNGTDPRTTANLCTPGTNVVRDGKLFTPHCVNSTSKTYHGEQWVRSDLKVWGGERIEHWVEGEKVIEYEKPQVGGGNVSGHDPDVKKDGSILTEGTISLQSESHPIEFRKVELLNLSGCVDPLAKNYKAYFVHADNKQCKY